MFKKPVKGVYQSSGLTASGSLMYSGSSSSQPSGFTASSSAILAGASSSLREIQNQKKKKEIPQFYVLMYYFYAVLYT